MFSLRSIVLVILSAAILLIPTTLLRRQIERSEADVPLAVAAAYLRAVYARDFRQAYKYISTADTRVRDEASYIESQPRYKSFALRLARQLASYGEIRVLSRRIDSSRAQLELAYRFPAMEEIAERDGDVSRLNSLPLTRQAQLLRSLHDRNQAKSLVMVTGRETYQLVREDRRWRLFFDWANSLRVQLDSAPVDSLAVHFGQEEIFVTDNDPFQVNLTVKNTGAKPLRIAVAHHIEPKSLANELTMIECGLSRPVTLDPGTEREFSMAYILGTSVRHIREIKLTYVFHREIAVD